MSAMEVCCKKMLSKRNRMDLFIFMGGLLFLSALIAKQSKGIVLWWQGQAARGYHGVGCML